MVSFSGKGFAFTRKYEGGGKNLALPPHSLRRMTGGVAAGESGGWVIWRWPGQLDEGDTGPSPCDGPHFKMFLRTLMISHVPCASNHRPESARITLDLDTGYEVLVLIKVQMEPKGALRCPHGRGCLKPSAQAAPLRRH